MPSKIKLARISAGLSSTEVAKRLGIDRTLYVKYETGTRTPKLARLAEIAKVLDVPLVQLADLPLHGVVTYSEGLLDKLEASNKEIQDLLKNCPFTFVDFDKYESWRLAVTQLYERHKAILDQALAERLSAFDFPDLGVPLEKLVGLTTKEIILDMRGEFLIDQGNRLALDLLNAKYSSIFTPEKSNGI